MRARLAAALAVIACTAVMAGPARAGEPLCLPFYGPTHVGISGKVFVIPGHSLPCQDVG